MTLGKRITASGSAALMLWGICLLFILIPLASFLAYGFLPVVDNHIVYRPTFDNFQNLFSNSSYRTTFLRTMRMALEVSALNFVLGYATAYFIWRRPPAWRNLLVVALAIPLLMSYIIKIYAMRGVLGTNGLLNSALLALGIADEPVSALLFNLTAVRITLSVVLLPFMVLPIYVALERISSSTLHAAADLGATELQTFRWVILPLSLPGGIVRRHVHLRPRFGRLSRAGASRRDPGVHIRQAGIQSIRSRVQLAARRGAFRPADGGRAGGDLCRPSSRQPALATMKRIRLVDIPLTAVAVFVYVSLYLPILLVFVLSFFSMRRGKVNWDTFSLSWYAKLFEDDTLGSALWNSLLVGSLAIAAASAFATSAALFVKARSDARSARLLEYVIFLPFLLPPIITGLSLLIYFREAGVGRGIFTITVGHALFVSAIIYRIVLTRLNALSRNLVEAAQDLGASRIQTFRFIILPNLRMPLLTAGLLAFALSFDETMITLFLSGTDSTLPVRLYAMMRVGFTPSINALITLILGFSIVLTVAVALAWRRNAALGGGGAYARNGRVK